MQRSLGLKLLLIIGLALIIWIPITLVSFKIDERQNYHREAANEVSRSWTGQQNIISPVLIIPYQYRAVVVDTNNPATKSHKLLKSQLFISATKLNSKIVADNTILKKGIYQIPVYNSKIKLQGYFSTPEIIAALDKIRNQDGFKGFETAHIKLYFSDLRGVNGATQFSLNQQPAAAKIDQGLKTFPGSLSIDVEQALLSSGPRLSFEADLKLRGMDSLSFTPMADNATLALSSNWPHPKFSGASLPNFREVNDQGFSAQWQSNKYSNNNLLAFTRCYRQDDCQPLASHSSGVSFIDPVDVYLQSERSIKYAMLFIGLIFISFFIFEHVKKLPIHPIQYTFVGLAIAIFYLLLISLAEHMAFHWAYLIAAGACSSLLFFYLQFILHSVKAALLFTAMVAALYSLLFVIVQAEDFALLMGSCLVFTVLVCLMTVTRNIDWYSLNKP